MKIWNEKRVNRGKKITNDGYIYRLMVRRKVHGKDPIFPAKRWFLPELAVKGKEPRKVILRI